MAGNNEFVDLDEIVPGTGFSKKQDESVKKKETPPQKKENSDSFKVTYVQTEQEDEFDAKEPEEEKKPEEKKKREKEETNSKEELPKFEEKPKSNGSNGKKEKAKEPVKESTSKPEMKKPVKKETFTQIMAKKKESIKHKPVKKIEHKKESKVVNSRKERSEKKNNGKETNWTLIALLILAVIIIGVIVYIAIKFDFTKSNQESVVAVVNGQPIYKSELMNRYNLLKSTVNPLITEEQVLNLTITDKLLLQQAAKKGITTSSEEVTALIDQIMAQNNIGQEELKQDLGQKNVSYDFLIDMYKNTLTINKLINESFNNLSVSDEELQTFYDTNKDSLKVPDMVQVRHILFLFGNESEQTTYARAEEVFNMINSDRSNFCDLVLKYNEDTGSNQFCGEYNFSIDYPFVPEFLQAGFDMKPGEVRIVKSQLGYHVMYKIADLPGYVPELNDIKDKLRPALIKEKTVKELDTLIASLQDEAIIEIYSENISTKRFNEVTIAKEETSVADSQNEDAVPQEVVSEEQPVAEDAGVTGTTTQVEVTTVSTPKSQKMLLANCLNDKGARMFTQSWSPDSKTQLELFGDYASSLKIVECDPQAVNADPAECSKVLKKQYPTWPTWQIGDVLYEGIQSLNALSKYSGCPY